MGRKRKNAEVLTLFSNALEVKFSKELQAKNSWGKNAVEELFKKINSELLIAYVLGAFDDTIPMSREEL